MFYLFSNKCFKLFHKKVLQIFWKLIVEQQIIAGNKEKY